VLTQQLLKFLPERKISVSREISKKFEETVRGDIETVLNYFNKKEPKGEFVVIIDELKSKKQEIRSMF